MLRQLGCGSGRNSRQVVAPARHRLGHRGAAPLARDNRPARRSRSAASVRPCAAAAARAGARSARRARRAACRRRSCRRPDSRVRSAGWRCCGRRRSVSRSSCSHSRRRSPLRSFQGMPVSCTRVPGAWPTSSSRARRARCGRSASGRAAARSAQSRAGAHLAPPSGFEARRHARRRAGVAHRPARSRSRGP